MDYNKLEKLLYVCDIHDIQLKQAGNSYWAKCPLHTEKTASFQVKITGYWRCHGCGENGDALDLYQKLALCTFPEAKKALGLDDGRPLPPKKIPKWPDVYEEGDPRKAYVAARDSMYDRKDMVIKCGEIEEWNHKFVVRCLNGSDREVELATDIYNRLRVTNGDVYAQLFLNELLGVTDDDNNEM